MIEVKREADMQQFGEQLGRLLKGGEVIELVGDVGAGKTTLVRGVARGMGVDEAVQSPSFTISRLYDAPDQRRLVHYDFYRLADAGIMQNELADTIATSGTAVVIEWAGTVEQVLPADRLVVTITPTGDTVRQLSLKSGGQVSQQLAEALR